MTTALASFFDAVPALLRGDASASEVERTLGASRSGTHRLGFYRSLVANDLHHLVEELFPALAIALEREHEGSFGALVARYLRAHPPSHWDPARAGDRLADFLERERSRGVALPDFAEELADFYEVKRLAAEDPAEEGALDRTVFIRRYAFDVPRYVRAIDDVGCASAARAVALPAASTSIVVVYRSAHDLRVHVLRPSLAALLALAGGADPRFPEVDDAALAAARDELRTAGVLSASALQRAR